MSRPHSTSTRRPVVAAAALCLLALTACSADDAGDSAASAGDLSVADGGSAEPLADEAAGTDRATTAAGAGTADVAAAVADRRLARRADVELTVDDVAQAAARLRQIALGADGLVVQEQVSSDPVDPAATTRPAGWGTVTISVPADRLDTTLDAVAEVGTVVSRSTETEDVTAQYVDTASRVESMQASVARVRALMADATKLSDVVALEAELSRRQADLEAYQRRLASLQDRTTLSPITVQLSTDGTAVPEDEDPTGFVAGLASGWDAFTTSVRLVLTLLGALLPFAVTAALVVAPVVWWVRRRRPAPAAATPAAATPAPPAA